MSEVDDQHRADDVHADTPADVETGQLAEGGVPKQHANALAKRHLGPARLAVRALPGRRVDREPGQDDEDAVRHTRPGVALRTAAEGVGDGAERDGGGEGADQGSHVPIGIERGPGVVSGRHLRLQRQVRHREHRHRETQEHVPERVVDEHRELGVRRRHPQQRVAGAEGNRGEQEEGPPPPPLPAHPIGDAPHGGVGEGVHHAAQELDGAGELRPESRDLREEVEDVDDVEGDEDGVDGEVARRVQRLPRGVEPRILGGGRGGRRGEGLVQSGPRRG